MNGATPRITLYSLPGCRLCRRIRDHLASRDVPFREVNILAEPRALARLVTGHRPVLPLVQFPGHLLQAPDLRTLNAALARLPRGSQSPRTRSPRRPRTPVS